MNEFEFVNKHLGAYKIDRKNNEIQVETCPFCGNGSHNDKYSFSINYDKHLFKCWRGKCGARGTFDELCKQYGEVAEYMKDFRKKRFERIERKKQYVKPKMQLENISKQALEYLKLRGISEGTISHFEIVSDKNGNIVFQYKNENGEHVLNKIRIPRKFVKGKDKTKTWQEGGGQPILLGMNKIDVTKSLVITEGEFDCLAVYESGYSNVVSIPFGTENMNWIDECWDFLEATSEVVLWYDNDEAGRKAVNEVARKIGIHKCKIAKSEYKDANVEMFKNGKEGVLKVIEEADFIPIQNLSKLSECKAKKVQRILYGNQFLDYYLGGCRMGEIAIWTGKRGSGKSTVLNQTLCDTVEQKERVFIYTGELNNSKVKEWLERQLAGERYIVEKEDELTRRTEYVVDERIVPILEKWYDDYIFAYGDDGEDDINSLLEVMEYAYRRYNVKRFVIDNLKTLEINSNDDINEKQKSVINKIRKFALQYEVHVDLVVHPRKTLKNELDDEDVGGTSSIIDLAHCIIEVAKIDQDKYLEKEMPEDLRDKYLNNDTRLGILKNREYGDTGVHGFYKFNHKSKRIYGKHGAKSYSWEKLIEDRNIVLDEKDYTEVKEVKCPWD